MKNNFFLHESSYVDAGSEIGSGTKVWHFSHILGNVKIGKNCTIGQNVVIGPNVVLGDNCKVQNNVSIYEGVIAEDNVFFGPSCVFTNVINPRANVERKEEFKPTYLMEGATIGANATIICGVKLNKYCMVGAGSVVTRDVKKFSIVIGNPANHYKWISKRGAILGEDLKCPETNEQYFLDDLGELETE